MFCYPKQVNLRCFFFLWLYDTSCEGLAFPIFSLELDSNLEKESIVSCLCTPPSYLKNVSCKRFGEGVAQLCLHTLKHTWLGTMDSGSSLTEALQVKNGAVLVHSSIGGECKIRWHSLPPRFPFDSLCGPLFRPAEEWAQRVSNQSFNWLQNEKLW